MSAPHDRAPGIAGSPWWERHARAPLPSLRGDVRCDVLVVGLGGSGLSCIGELRARGASVVGIDARVVADGAAGRNGGFLLGGLAAFHHDAVRVHGRERAVTLYRRTLAEIERIAAETPNAVRPTGSLRIAASDEEHADCAAHLETMRADGLPAEPYEGAEGRGLHFPEDAAFDPVGRALALARAATTAGARLFERSPVRALRAVPGGVEAETDAGRVSCAAVVVAVDGRLEQLLPELAGRVRTARLQMLAADAPDSTLPPRPVYSRWGYDYWQRMPDGALVLGGCRDIGGEAEWTDATTTSDVVQSALERLLRETLGVRGAVTHRWAASVGYTPDGLPIAAEVRPGVWAVGGYCGTGNVVGAMCGRAAAAAALGEHPQLFDLLAPVARRDAAAADLR